MSDTSKDGDDPGAGVSQQRFRFDETCLGCLAARQILDRASFPAFLVAPDGSFLYINDACLEMIGSPGRQFSMAFNAFTLPAIKEIGYDRLIRRCLAGETIQAEAEYVSMFGRRAPGKHLLLPLRDHDGTVMAAGVVVQPLDRERELEGTIDALRRELEDALLEQREMDQLRDRFIAIVSHEFRTPLVPIMGYMQMLADGRLGPLTEGQQQALDVASRNTRRLLELVEKVLAVSSHRQAPPMESLKPLAVEPSLREAAETMRPVLRGRKLSVSVRCEPGLPPVLCEPNRLQRILMTLLDNARKYAPKGGKVELRGAVGEAGRVSLTVANTGPQIPRAERKRIFEPFYQAENPLTRTHGGMGLGLAIVRESAAALGGSVQVVDLEGFDAAIQVDLPRADQALWLDLGGKKKPPPRRFQVLLVDADAARRARVRAVLEGEGVAPVELSASSQAERALHDTPPNVVILGLDSEDNEGHDLIRTVRTGEGARLLPIFAVTSAQGAGARRRALDLGATAVLQDPVDLDSLRRLIAAVKSTIL